MGGHGPGAARGGDFPADIEIRYNLGREDSGRYIPTVRSEHKWPNYPAASMTEARFTCQALADTFDWMTIDASATGHLPRRPP